MYVWWGSKGRHLLLLDCCGVFCFLPCPSIVFLSVYLIAVWHYTLGFSSCLQYYKVCEIQSVFTLCSSREAALHTKLKKSERPFFFFKKVFDNISKLIVLSSCFYLYQVVLACAWFACLFIFLPLLSSEGPGISTKYSNSMGIHGRLTQCFDAPDALDKHYNRHLKGNIQSLSRYVYHVCLLTFDHREVSF